MGTTEPQFNNNNNNNNHTSDAGKDQINIVLANSDIGQNGNLLKLVS